jgi:hypothetical protein
MVRVTTFAGGDPAGAPGAGGMEYKKSNAFGNFLSLYQGSIHSY